MFLLKVVPNLYIPHIFGIQQTTVITLFEVLIMQLSTYILFYLIYKQGQCPNIMQLDRH